MDEVAVVGTSSESTSKSLNLDGARRMALKHIEAFVRAFSDPQAFSAAAASSTHAALLQVTELARIHEAGHLRCRFALVFSRSVICLTKFSAYLDDIAFVGNLYRRIFEFGVIPSVLSLLMLPSSFCSGAEIGRFVTMLRNPSSTLKACATFALLQV